jgi:hypothetical protein
MADKLSEQRAKKLDSTTTAEHLRRLEMMAKRISSLGSMTDRKKNPFDPVAHPTLLMRREFIPHSYEVTPADLAAGNLPRKRPSSASSQRNSQHGGGGGGHGGRNDGSGSPGRHSSVSGGSPTRSATGSNSRHAHGSSSYSPEHNAHNPALGTPKHQHQEEQDPYFSLRDSIVAQVVEERIFQEADLRRLFEHRGQLAVERDHLDPDRVEHVLESLRMEFEVVN